MKRNNQLIAVLGLPGTGKTTFAGILATKLQAVHLNTDKIRSHLGKRGQYDPQSKQEIYEALISQTRDALDAGKTVIIDATFYRKELRAPFIKLAKDLEIDLHWIEIKAAEETIRQRVSKKRTYSEADFSVYLKIKNSFEPLVRTPLPLWSDRQSMEEMITRALQHCQRDSPNLES